MLEVRGGDGRIGLPAQVEHHVLAGCGLEEIEREVGGQDAPHAVAPADLGQPHLAVDDDLGAALDGRDDHVDALGGAIERGMVGEVTLDQLGAACQQRVECGAFAGSGAAADQEAEARLGLV